MEVKRTIANADKLVERVNNLTSQEVLVGIPGEKTARDDTTMTNAAIAYVHEFGSPAQHIPERSFLRPGVRNAREEIASLMRQGAKDALAGRDTASKTLNAVGMVARNAVVRAITNPAPPFAPLQPATIRGRLRRTQAGRRKLRNLAKIKAAAGWRSGNPALLQWAGETVGGIMNIRPLLDTLRLRNAITYVIRPARRPPTATWFGFQRDYGQIVTKFKR